MGEKIVKVPFEEALNQTGFGKFNFSMTVVCGLMIIAMVFESLSVSYLVPASACELNTTTVQQGLIAAVPLVGIIASSHIWGYLADTRGRRKILQFSLILGFATGALSALSPHWLVLCAFKIVSSGAVSGTFALAFTLLGETTPNDKRNMVILLTTSVYLVSTGLMAVLAIPVLPLHFSYYIPYLGIHFNSWRVLCLIYSLPCALAALGAASVCESPKYLLSMGLEEEALGVLKTIYTSNTGKDPDDFPVKSLILNEDGSSTEYKGVWASIKAQTMPLTRPPLLKNTFILALEFALIYFCINPYIVWLPFIADGFIKSMDRGDTGLTFCQMIRSTHDAQNLTMANVDESPDCSLNNFAMIIVLINGFVLSALNLVISGVVNWLGRKRLLISVQIVTGIAGLCINASTSTAVTAVLLMTYIANCLNFGVLTTFSVNLFPTYLKAMAVCLTLMVGRASAIVGINVLKQLLISNCELSFYIFAGLTVAGGFLGVFLPGDDVSDIPAYDPEDRPAERRSPET
ncbi:synaptic vesicle glycoprotein 2B-like [Choristoneura fumiferana]|uniref:synaptic vesicle glycoprotein 2B-like n=1 Tax=Choristoneura fumiferana TaxID=7141 RepID=UPI003D15CB8B